MTLTPKQAECVNAVGQDVCVAAGPGSGKTRVLTARFRWLIDEKKVDPRRILAITFTEKAATEIKKRLIEQFAARREIREAIERAWVSTVHGFCARLLREHAIEAGVDPEFRVLDENEADAALEETAVETLDRLLEENKSGLRLLLDRLYVSSNSAGRHPDLARALITVYEAMRVAGAAPQDLRMAAGAQDAPGLGTICEAVRRYLATAAAATTSPGRLRHQKLSEWLARAEALPRGEITAEHFRVLSAFKPDFSGLRPGNPYYDAMMPLRETAVPEARAALIARYNAPLYGLIAEALSRLDAAWRGRKREMGALDFADLEETAIRLLRGEPAVAGRIRESFDAVLMDELQDTNPLQWTLVNLLRRPERFFAVGDVNQSIFGFRHASPEVFLSYRDSVEASGKPVHTLLENHRSRPEILEAVNRVFSGAWGVEPHELTSAGTFGPAGTPVVEVIVAKADGSAAAAALEAAWIAWRILELRGRLRIPTKDGERPAAWSDFAVLGRSLNALEPVRKALEAARIPALVAGGRSFYETREVRDLVAWLAVLANPRDEVSLAGVLRSPLVGVRDETLLRLSAGGKLAGSLARLEKIEFPQPNQDDRLRLQEFAARLARLRPLRDAVPPDRLAADALDAAGYASALAPHGRANVEKFLGLLRDMYTANPRPLRETLEELARLRLAASEPEAPPGESANAVRLMTIHKAKGLEFPVVFVPALQRGVDPSKPVICFDPAAGVGVRWRDPAGGSFADDPVYRRYMSALQLRERAEENRLLYVAMTRAGQHLVLSCAKYPRSSSPEWVQLVRNGLKESAFREVDGPPPGGPEAPAEAGAPEEEILERPVVSGQYDSAAPVTSLAVFRACPRRYFLGRYAGWQGRRRRAPEDVEDADGPDPGEIDSTELGRQTHSLLAGEKVENASPEAVELAAAFHRSELGRRAARASRSGREVSFLCALDDVVLSGQIDLWFEEGGALVLVDYKTDRITAADEERLEPYRHQLRLYAFALERLLGRGPALGFLHLLRTGESVQVDLPEDTAGYARRSLEELRRAQEQLDFPMREGRQCLSCGFYKGLCRAGTLLLQSGH